MNISRIFIERPVLTTLAMAALVIFGIFGYASLPVSDLPNVDFPTITVNAGLPGADPDTMASGVAAPLENQFSTIAGIDSMTSSSRQGGTSITIQFTLDRNIDSAAQDVQAAISAATRQLPRAMPSPPTFRKVNPADFPVMFIALTSDTIARSALDEYAETLLARQISTISGVADVSVFGNSKYAVRVQADPDALAARQIGIDTLSNAVSSSNVNLATGALNGSVQSSTIHANGQLNSAAEFNNQVIAYRNGSPVRLKDVGKAIDGYQNPFGGSWFRGKQAIVLSISRQPGSNTVAVIARVREILPHFQEGLPKAAHLEVIYDRSHNIRDAINDVQLTLLIAAALVVGVIFIFLRRVTATLIPSLALPIAVVATFAGMSVMGFSLDNLSLMALTLSVGFVVDDAIVMLENIVRHIEHGEKPYEAAMKGSVEIGFTILSMTVSLAAVFIPIVFMGGIVGRLLHEFAVTIIIAILFSGVISVTLTPMLCARILKSEEGQSRNFFYRWSEDGFNAMAGAYQRTLAWSLAHRPVILGVFVASIVASIALFAVMPQDFLPADDGGRLTGQIQAQNGTSSPQMQRYLEEVTRVINNDPNVEGVFAQIQGGNGTAGSNGAFMPIIVLKPRAERKLSADEIIRELRPKLNRFPGVNVFLTNPPTIRIGGRGSRSQYQYTMQDLDLTELQVVSDRLMNQMRSMPDFVDVNSDLDAVMPAVQVKINRDRAAALGVNPQQIETALSEAFSGQQVSQINTSANQYVVILELLPEFQASPASLQRLYITSNTGQLVPLSAVTTMEAGTQPLSVNHSGQVPAVTLSFDLPPGKALSDAVTAIREASEAAGIPDSVTASFQGTAAAFQSSTQNMSTLLFIAMIVVYIILGILYESFIHPLTILSGLPSAALGALLTLYIFGVPLTLYAFVGMIMLIGIVKKNAIMMIDFALERQRANGIAPEQAIYEAAITRFRPIMMTTMAAMMGTLPIALGLCVAGGLLLSQLLTLYITPVIYTYLDRYARKIAPKASPSPLPAE